MLILLALLVTGVVANDNLRVAYQWKQIDFEFPNIDERQAAITNLTFISENIIPVGLEVYKNRLFVTLPRWKKGVAASLAYIDLNGKYCGVKLMSDAIENNCDSSTKDQSSQKHSAEMSRSISTLCIL